MDKQTTSVEISAQGQGFVLVDVGTWLYSLSQFTACFPLFLGGGAIQWKGKNPWYFSFTIRASLFTQRNSQEEKQTCYVDLWWEKSDIIFYFEVPRNISSISSKLLSGHFHILAMQNTCQLFLTFSCVLIPAKLERALLKENSWDFLLLNELRLKIELFMNIEEFKKMFCINNLEQTIVSFLVQFSLLLWNIIWITFYI